MSNNLPDFMFATGTRVMRTAGYLRQVTLEDARAAAESAGTAVVGLIPFDPNAPRIFSCPNACRSTTFRCPSTRLHSPNQRRLRAAKIPGIGRRWRPPLSV
uniref:hypothetical protein n=1 Tax=Rothia dentocariosa TaxID=2047 RepID=UPI003FA3D00F